MFWHFIAHPVFTVSLLVNGIIGGDIHETISARAGYARQRGNKSGERVCKVLDALDPRHLDHCDTAVANDIERRGKDARTDGNGKYFKE